MARRLRILVALLLPALTGLGPLVGQHDDVHRDGVGAEQQITAAATHADETGHVEGAGRMESTICFSCLLRLPSSGTLVPPARLEGAQPAHHALAIAGRGRTPLRLGRQLPTRGPPLA